MKKHRLVVYGCGVMGLKIAQAIKKKNSFEIVAAVDIRPDLIGSDPGMGVTIEGDAEEVLLREKPDAVILTTTSHLEKVKDQITQCVLAGANVVSTCEELAFPWKRHPDLARDLDELARRQNVTVVGTGINPGYLMDTLPLMLTAPCLRVDAVQVRRTMDSSKRRMPFQKKVGMGLTKEEFESKIADGSITGHVGLLESIHTIASGLGWTLDEAVELPPEPELAGDEVLGLRSVAHGRRGGEDVITLEFIAHGGVEEECDEVTILGDPDIRQKIVGGVHGDTGTISMTLNTIPRAIEATPGVKTMKDLGVPACVS